MEACITTEELDRFSDFIAELTGLHFPPARRPELRRGLAATASTLGFEDTAECARQLMTEPILKSHVGVLASHLTVGETYFFRDPRCFEILEHHILPTLIRSRQSGDRRLRIWSAACCSGEEAYSIAITLRRMIPDIDHWNLTLLATDINPGFLDKAEAGLFSTWSFRDEPSWLKERYFRPTADGLLEIVPEVKRMVQFARLNLADDVYPSPVTNTGDMDIIFCRNVLMYFTTAQAKRVLRNLYRAQAESGWLMISPAELSHVSDNPYTTANFPGAIVLRKLAAQLPQTAEAPSIVPVATLPPSAVTDPVEEVPPIPIGLNEMTRVLANEGRMVEALGCCDRLIADNKLNPSAHYLKALLFQEQGELDNAHQSLQKALYLNPEFVLVHFAMGNIARSRGRDHEAGKHFGNALQLLRGCRSEEILPDAEGVSAGHLVEIINRLVTVRKTK